MASDAAYSKAVADLRGVLAKLKPGQKNYDEILARRDEVLAKYQPVFSSAHIPNLSREEFTSFLYIENNHHWTGLYRKGLSAASDLKKLRSALALLLDESKPIRDRLPASLELLEGFGRATATGILTVAYPDKYGVLNNTAETALRLVGLWPKFEKGEGFGGRYEKLNALFVRLCADLGTDFWTLDLLWWHLLEGGRPPASTSPASIEAPEPGAGFALESQLEAFLLENWAKTPLGKEWDVYSTDDDPEYGNQFPTDIGQIDILAKHKTQARLLVVELKRDQSSDQTVGQALRYVGWIQKNLAKAGEKVEALIIAHQAEKKVDYALLSVPHVRVMTYEVEFRLKLHESLT